MRPIWLIESDVFGISSELLKKEIRRQSMRFGLIDYDTFSSGYVRSVDSIKLQESECVICMGTWPILRHIQLHWPGWVPGVWCSYENLDCECYYQHFSDFMLNQDCTVLSGNEAIRQQNSLFEQHAKHDQVFVRPTGCVKVITGRCVDFVSFANALAPSRYDSETHVLISSPKIVTTEWRFIVADHQPIAVSQYHAGNEKQLSPTAPRNVWDFVNRVLTEVAWDTQAIRFFPIATPSVTLHCGTTLRVVKKPKSFSRTRRGVRARRL